MALGLLDLGRGEAEAGPDVVGHDLDLGAAVARFGLQLRCSRRPVTTTRAPLVRLRATFSASSRQQATSKKEVDSSHSLVSRFCHRRLTASDSELWAWPSLVYRISGSRVRLPATVTVVWLSWCVSPL